MMMAFVTIADISARQSIINLDGECRPFAKTIPKERQRRKHEFRQNERARDFLQRLLSGHAELP